MSFISSKKPGERGFMADGFYKDRKKPAENMTAIRLST
jgi:hypothetical protein